MSPRSPSKATGIIQMLFLRVCADCAVENTTRQGRLYKYDCPLNSAGRRGDYCLFRGWEIPLLWFPVNHEDPNRISRLLRLLPFFRHPLQLLGDLWSVTSGTFDAETAFLESREASLGLSKIWNVRVLNRSLFLRKKNAAYSTDLQKVLKPVETIPKWWCITPHNSNAHTQNCALKVRGT